MISIFLITTIRGQNIICVGRYPQIWSPELFKRALLKSVSHQLIECILLYRLQYNNKGTAGDVDGSEGLALIE